MPPRPRPGAPSTTCSCFTGKTVTDTQVAQASAALELHIGRTYYETVSNPDGGSLKVGRRDREWLRRACAYQAAWMLAQPDMYQRLDMDALASTGRPITLKDRALVLAPLARRALQRVSWLRSRSLQGPHPVHGRDRPGLPERGLGVATTPTRRSPAGLVIA